MKTAELLVTCDDGIARVIRIPLRGLTLWQWLQQPEAMMAIEGLKKLASERDNQAT